MPISGDTIRLGVTRSRGGCARERNCTRSTPASSVSKLKPYREREEGVRIAQRLDTKRLPLLQTAPNTERYHIYIDGMYPNYIQNYNGHRVFCLPRNFGRRTCTVIIYISRSFRLMPVVRRFTPTARRGHQIASVVMSLATAVF